MEASAIAKWGSLLSFCLQNSMHPIIMRFAMTEASSLQRANTSVILFVTETLKLVLSFLLLLSEGSFSLATAGRTLHEDWLSAPMESLPLAVPAIIYALQNALLQWSAGNLSAALWQVTYQGKILVTAAFSVVLLRKKIKRVQWLAIAIMGLGIAIVQLSKAKEKKQDSMGNASEQDPVRGFLMLVLACCCSGFASVWTERVFKQVGKGASEKKKSVWLQNMQLAVFSMALTVVSFEVDVLVGGADSSVLKGFTLKTWVMAANNAIGGLLVALVIKHADNILRGFASAIATINAAVIAVFCFGFVIRASFGVGTIMVIGSTLLYGSVLRLPGEWWNSEFDLCRAAPQEESGKGYAGVDVQAEAETASIASEHERGGQLELQTTIGAQQNYDRHQGGG